MTGDFLEKNLAVIRRGSPELAGKILHASGQGLTLRPERARNGLPTLVAVREGKESHLHSRHDPLREARNTLQGAIPAPPDMIILGGFGLGYHAEAALALFPEAIVVVIEYAPAIMREAFRVRDLTPLLESGRLDLVVSEELDDIIPLLEGRATRQTSMVLHRPSCDLFPEFYLNLRNILHSFLNSKEVNLATLARFEKLWTRNLLRNFDIFRRAPGVAALYGGLQDVPAFVVGAGPSLGKNIAALRDAAERGVIIAVDTVYKVLLAHGIDPHFVVAVDPQLVNTQYFRGVRNSRSILVTDGAVYPTLLHNFAGQVYISAVPFPFAVWYQRQLGEKGALSSGGSVSTTAFDLAWRMGCNPVTLVGQDLAYSEERIHVRGASGEELWENSANRLTPVTRNMRSFLKKNRTVKIPAYHPGGTVWSDRKFLTFLWWFERKLKQLPELTVWNATEGGAAISGAVPRPLAAIVAELSVRTISLPRAPGAAPADPGVVRGECGRLLAYLQTTAAVCREGGRLLQKLLKRGTAPGPRELAQLEEVDRQIGSEPAHAAILSSTLQRVIHSVGEGLSLENAQEALDTRDPLAVLRQNRALYTAVEEACGSLTDYLRKYLLKDN